MKKLLLTIFTTILILLLPCMAWAATYTVTQTGGGADYSVAQFNALTGSKAGDTFNFSGTITSKVVPAIYGTSGNHVILDGGDIDGVHATIDRNGGADGMWITGKDYITIQDFEITDFTGDGGLVLYQGCDHVNIYNCIIHNGWHRGIFLATNNSYITIGGSAANGNHLYNCGMDDSAGSDIDVYASRDVVISYNKLHGDATHGVDGINTMYSDRILIEYNEIYNHKQIGQTENAIDLKASTNDVIIRFNEMYGHPNPEEGTIHVSMDSDDVAIYGNRIYDGNIGILIFDGAYGWTANGTHMNNIKIWSNLIYDNEWGGIWVYLGSPAGDSINDVVIYNNVIAENGNSGTGHTGIGITTGTGHVIKNNIFYKNRPSQSDYIQAYYTGTVTSDYNQYYWPSHTSYIYSGGSNKTVGNVEANGSDGDPGLTNVNINDYTLLGTSACKDTGVDLSGLAMSITIQGTTYDMYYDDCLDDSYIDFSTTPPTVRVIKQDDYGSWERGAFVYTEGAGVNQAPNGTIDTPASNPTVEVNDSVTLAGSYTDPEGDTCTYAWVIEAHTFKLWEVGTTYGIGDIVEHADGSGTFYRSKVADNTGNTPAIDANWENAETVQNPGTGVCDTAGIYSISLTVSDDAPLADPTPASRTITVNTVTVGATTEVWGQNTGDDYGTDAITYINADQGACESSETILDDSYDYTIGQWTGDSVYRGSIIAKVGGYPDTCQIKLRLKRTGTLTGRTFYIYEVLLSGSNLDLDNKEEVGGMDAQLISTSWTVYTFECAHNLTEGRMLVVMVDGTPSSTNYISFTVDDDSNANLGDQIRYTDLGVYQGVGNYDFYIEIWEGGAALDDTNYGSATSVYAKKITVGGTDNQKIAYSVDLVALSGETVNDAKLELWLETAPTANMNVEVWSCADAFVEGEATWNIYSTGNAWTGTHGQTTFLGEVAFTSASSTGQYYTFTGGDFVSAVGTAATAGGVARLILISDTNDISAIAFTSDDGTDEHRPKLTIQYGAEAASVPEVVSIDIPGWKATYKEGEVIPAPTITFSEPVKGTSLVLTLDTDSDGANDATSTYTSGSGTATYTMTAVTVTSDHGTDSLDALTLTTPAGVIESTDDDEDIPETADVIDTIPLGATIGSLAYNTDIVIDTTVPAAASVNNTDSHASKDVDSPFTVIGTIIQFAIVLGETGINVNAEPGYPRIAMTVHPVDTVYAYAMGLGDTTGTVMMGFPLTAGMRSLDLNFTGALDLGPGGTITDGSGNPVSTDMGVLDLSAVAAIVIAVPKPSTDPWIIGATGDYATYAAFDTATYSIPGDVFDCNFTGPLNTDASGTSGHEIVYRGTVTGPVVVDEDYINLERLIIQ